MREVILYIAMSLDGYIADAQGGVDWLGGHGEPEEGMESYSRLLQRIDTVVMGWNTYHQVTTQLSPDRWVYEGLHTYVVTHRPLPAAPGIRASPSRRRTPAPSSGGCAGRRERRCGSAAAGASSSPWSGRT